MERSPVLIRRRKMFSGWAAAIMVALLAFGPRSAVADTIRISGAGSAIGTIHLIGEAFRKAYPDVPLVLFPSMDSSGAVKAVLAGDLDIGFCTRSLNDKERAGGAVEAKYARTPLVFGVNRAVHKTGLTLASAAEIYAGKRNQWEDGGRIRLVLKPPRHPDIQILKSMSPEMKAAVESALLRDGMIVAVNDQEAADLIENVPGAFGAISLALVLSEKRAICVLALNGIVPGVRALVDGSYPYSKTFYMVTRKNPPAAVRRFIDFVRSSAGASILAKNGQAAVR